MNASTRSDICCICKKDDSDELAYGTWETVKGYKAHQFCLLLLAKSKHMSNDDIFERSDELLKEFESSICYVCMGNNATISCSVQNCQRSFHLVCAEKKHCLIQYVEPYNAFCDEHHGLSEIPPMSWKCQTCWEQFKKENNQRKRSPVEYIPSCCRHGWYHRQCIRKQAHFSGSNMKCPSCGEKDEQRAEYQRFVQTRGVYIPNRSALYPLQLDKKKNFDTMNNECLR